MTEEESFQTLSHTVTDLPTEETEVVDTVMTMTDGQWVVNETDSKEDLKVDQMASHTAALGRESTTVTASTAIKRVTSQNTVMLLEEKDQIVVAMVVVDVDEDEVVTVTMTIVETEEIEEIEETEETEVKTEVKIEEWTEEWIEEDHLIEDKTTSMTVSESVE
jgi:hypothetical protein